MKNMMLSACDASLWYVLLGILVVFGGVKFDVALGAVSIFVCMADGFLLPGFSVQFYGMNLSVNIENTLFSFCRKSKLFTSSP